MLDALNALARAAGREIMAIYERDIAVTTKDDDSPLTAADLAAHRCIKAGLQKLAPEIPLLSEEGADIPYAERARWDRYWLVDPLDGTKEFIKRNGEFTVNIALIENGRPTLAVVHAPALDVSYLAGAGGALKQSAEEAPAAIVTRPVGAAPWKVLVSRSHRAPEIEDLLSRMPAHEPVSAGSSLKFCLVAEGSADFYPRLGLTSEWDTAAGQAVVEAAGGAVLQLDGTPLRYNTKESLLNPHFLVVGDTGHDWMQYLAA